MGVYKLAVAVVLFLAGVSNAQVFQRSDCPNGNCPLASPVRSFSRTVIRSTQALTQDAGKLPAAKVVVQLPAARMPAAGGPVVVKAPPVFPLVRPLDRPAVRLAVTVVADRAIQPIRLAVNVLRRLPFRR